MSVKELKKNLHGLKKNSPEKGHEIQNVSRIIRKKLKHKKSMNTDEGSTPIDDISSQFRKHFWRTCKRLFKPVENILPSFSMESCVRYFSSILSQKFQHKLFIFPDWIEQLPTPAHPFDTSPPTYKEVSRAIFKAKSRASSCPLDQISCIILKRCPILRTILHRIIVECWKTSSIPSCWKKGLSILIYKKGDPADPANFRPITLQPVLYKVLASVIRNRIFLFLEKNNFVDKHIQKGFWPTIDGVAEHTQVLSHVIQDAKRHQRSSVIALLDLRNAFGEINHDLISASLKYHHVPNEIIDIIRDIYTGSKVSVAVNKTNTYFIPVDRGVLQGDPSSPLLFNLCFYYSYSICVLIRWCGLCPIPKFKHLGYMWGPNVDPYSSSWLQFADDTAIIANDVKSAQTLINLNVA